MKLGRLLLIAGAALAVNELLKTEKGQKLKKDVADKAGVWKEKLNKMAHKNGDHVTSLKGYNTSDFSS